LRSARAPGPRIVAGSNPRATPAALRPAGAATEEAEMTDAGSYPTNDLPTVGVGSFLDVDGVTLHARRDGAWGAGDGRSPAPPLLYLHALGADLRVFDGVVARLPHHRHLRLDLRE